MIHTNKVLRYQLVEKELREGRKALDSLEKERNDLRNDLISRVIGNERIETGCPYRLEIETKKKTFNPPYKDCAIALAGEVAVENWVKANDPGAMDHKLKLVEREVKTKKTQVGMAAEVKNLAGKLVGPSAPVTAEG